MKRSQKQVKRSSIRKKRQTNKKISKKHKMYGSGTNIPIATIDEYENFKIEKLITLFT